MGGNSIRTKHKGLQPWLTITCCLKKACKYLNACALLVSMMDGLACFNLSFMFVLIVTVGYYTPEVTD
jgi:hypothetical protein